MNAAVTMEGLSVHRQVIVEDLRRLNKVRAGLGDAAAAYVLEGTDGTVLSSIAALVKNDELEVDKAWGAQKRRHLFARAHPYDLERMERYTDVLCASAPSMPSHAVGTAQVPRRARIFFSEVFLGVLTNLNVWPRSAEPLAGKGLVLEKALAMLQRLGGTPVDFIDLLYQGGRIEGSGGEGYRQAEDLRPFFMQHPQVLAEAGARLSVTGRVVLLTDLREWRIAAQESFAALLVRQAADSSKAVREAALGALALSPPAAVEPLAVQLLSSGGATARLGMVDLLARLPLPGARAALAERRGKEKTARLLTAIDTALALVNQRTAPAEEGAAESGYVALDGRRIAIPPRRPVQEGPCPRFGEEEASALKGLITAANEEIRRRNEQWRAQGHKHVFPDIDAKGVGGVIRYLNGEGPAPRGQMEQFLSHGRGAAWCTQMLGRLPDARALPLARGLSYRHSFTPSAYGAGAQRVDAYLRGPDADLRSLEALDIAAGLTMEYGDWRNRRSRPARQGDFLRSALQDNFHGRMSNLTDIPHEVLWPYLAENLSVFDEAFGLVPGVGVTFDRVRAIQLLTRLPATPARYYAPLLEIGAGEAKSGRKEARALLTEAPGVEERLIGLLSDSRQGVRAGAAQWLAARGAAGAIAALHARLKTEKSELARAAFLTALASLGEDISRTLGPSQLLEEARKGLKSAKTAPAWLRMSDLALRYRSGERVPPEVLTGWCQLAIKLKQPGSNALFGIYLDQLMPEDAQAFSTWVLDAWIAYDTAHPSEEEANAHARAQAPSQYQAYKNFVTDYTEEKAFAQIKAQFLSQYLHSAADAKGVLALAARAPSTVVAERARTYLKLHGARTSQAGALLELLAGIGDAVSLQVVIAASLRLKQKSLQKLAGELVTKVAEAHDWTLDELADRTIPTAGFDSDGVLPLPCGEDGKPYEARLASDLSIKLRNPAAKEVASLPAGSDPATQASRKLLSTARKALKQVIALQSARLYEALCAERRWATDDWHRCFHEHPVMRRLIGRLVWVGMTPAGEMRAFRPTEEGDFTDAGDTPVDLSAFQEIRLAYGAALGESAVRAWQQHLADYEVRPLFDQLGRALLHLTPEQAGQTEIDDRRDWVTEAFTIRGASSRLGYERGPALDGGFFNEYRKSFPGAGLTAVVTFSGNSLPESNVPAALRTLSFERTDATGHHSVAVKLSEVPAVLLSECWNDYHAMAAKAVYDPEWAGKSPW